MIPFGPPQWLVLAVVLQRLGELALARRNTARLLAEGAKEHGAAHYPLFVILQAGWLAFLWLVVPEEASISWFWMTIYLLLQAGRIWVIVSLGRYWTTRVIVLPAVSLVRRGPYRWFRHPNYLIVACEIPILALVFGQSLFAVVFGALQWALLWHRIRIEDRALATFR